METLEIPNERAFEYYEPLCRLKQYVVCHYSEGEISLATAASVACLERKYFSTYFHTRVGVTFKSWLRALRISAAKTLMESNEHSITEVAHLVGFSDLVTFERAFKKQTGITPRQYKNLVRPTRICLPKRRT